MFLAIFIRNLVLLFFWSRSRKFPPDQFTHVSSTSIDFEQARGFGIYLVKSMLNGRGDEILDLARANWRALLEGGDPTTCPTLPFER